MQDGLRILLVEDDDVDRMRVHRAIQKAGMAITFIDAYDIAAARAVMESQPVDCAVIDYDLPDGTALDLLAYNEERGEERVPMVVLTGHDDEERALGALQHGAEDYLFKQRFEADTFFRSVRYALERASLRRDLEQTNVRLQRELEIGGSIQTSILPRNISVDGLEIAARMIPATEVGGDYYDVLPAQAGCWLGIGDVAGHGMSAAIVALMTQSIVASLTRFRPDASPGQIVSALNEVLYENIRLRLCHDEHVTFSLLRYHDGGRIQLAGAHEEILVHRLVDQRVDAIPTPGTWLGARRDIDEATVESELDLAVGDTLILYTDGVTEARDADGDQYGLERMRALVSRHHAETVDAILEHIWRDVGAFRAEQEDDITLLVVRRAT